MPIRKADYNKLNIPFFPPKDDREFERFCFAAYSGYWADPYAQYVGHPGKGQGGLDIIGHDAWSDRLTGVQCKNWATAPKISDIEKIIRIVEQESSVPIKHLVVAIPLPADEALQGSVQRISGGRKSKGEFTVSIDSAQELVERANYTSLSDLLRIFPDWAGSAIGTEGHQTAVVDLELLNAIDQIKERSVLGEAEKHLPLKSFQRWVGNDCFSDDYFERGEWVYLPVAGFHPKQLHFKIYAKAYGRLHSDCRRTVTLEGPDLDSCFRDNAHLINVYEHQDKSCELGARIFPINAGLLHPALDEMFSLLRNKGCVRVEWLGPFDSYAGYHRILVEDFGFSINAFGHLIGLPACLLRTRGRAAA